MPTEQGFKLETLPFQRSIDTFIMNYGTMNTSKFLIDTFPIKFMLTSRHQHFAVFCMKVAGYECQSSDLSVVMNRSSPVSHISFKLLVWILHPSN